VALDNSRANRPAGGITAADGRNLAAVALADALSDLMTTTLQETHGNLARLWREPRRLWLWVLFFITYGLLDRASALFLPGVLVLTPWDLAGGLAFGFLLVEGPGAAGLVALADLASDFLAPGQHSSLAAMTLAALVTGVSYGLASAWLRRLGAVRLADLRALVSLAIAAALAALAHVSADMAALGRWSLFADRAWAPAIVSAWTGAFVGILIVAPLFVLPWSRLKPIAGRDTVEAVLMGLAIVAVMAITLPGASGDPFRFFYLLFLPQIWIAVRFGVMGAVLGNLIVQIGLVIFFLAGLGSRDMVFAYQFRFMALVATILFLGCAVTERRVMEGALRERQEELARVARLSLAGEMAAALAHQLNQPLMAAMAFTRSAQRLLRADAGPEPEAACQAMDEAVVQSDRAAAIVRSLRDFIGRSTPARAATAVEPLAREAAQILGPECARRGIKISLMLDHGLPAALADAVQVQQVLINLIRNAVEALEDAPRPRVIEVRARRLSEHHLEVEVRDSGPGLPADIEARLFEPFATSKPRGMGLGLAVCRGLVEAQGGRLWLAENRPGACSFRFILPIVRGRPRPWPGAA
jgi:two-component system sensor kinase FixL